MLMRRTSGVLEVTGQYRSGWEDQRTISGTLVVSSVPLRLGRGALTATRRSALKARGSQLPTNMPWRTRVPAPCPCWSWREHGRARAAVELAAIVFSSAVPTEPPIC